MSMLDGYRPEVRRALPALVTQRWLTNIGVRVMFTFLPSFARGTGLTIEQMGQVLAVRDLTGLAAPALGRVADRKGTGPVMAFMGTVGALGLLLSIFSIPGLVAGFVLMGIGKVGFDVGLNAWIGDEVSYERRARAFGLIELTWAAAAIIGLPLCGILIDSVAWWAVPVTLGTLSLLVSVRVHQVADRAIEHDKVNHRRAKLTPQILLTMFSLGGLTLASQLLFVSHGIWLEDAHGLKPTSIGSVVLIFGFIEVVGTLSTTALTDRLGKKRSVLGGAGLLLIGTTSLAILSDPSLVLGLFLLAMAFLGFEFSFVSSLPLIAELDPKARAQIIGMFLGFGTLSRAGGTKIGTTLYVNQGFASVMTLGAAATALAIVGILLFVREPVTTPEPSEVLN